MKAKLLTAAHVGKLVLVRSDSYSCGQVEEVRVVEFAPSGEFVRLRTGSGTTLAEWQPVADLILLDVLGDAPACDVPTGGPTTLAGHRQVVSIAEFKEETGCETKVNEWEHFLTMGGIANGQWRVDFFVCVGDLSLLVSMEDEKVEVVNLDEVTPLRADMIENLPWLIPLALDFLDDMRPNFVTAHYP